jgi:hypothetical protein
MQAKRNFLQEKFYLLFQDRGRRHWVSFSHKCALLVSFEKCQKLDYRRWSSGSFTTWGNVSILAVGLVVDAERDALGIGNLHVAHGANALVPQADVFEGSNLLGDNPTDGLVPESQVKAEEQAKVKALIGLTRSGILLRRLSRPSGWCDSRDRTLGRKA